jgi:hypothetical protein
LRFEVLTIRRMVFWVVTPRRQVDRYVSEKHIVSFFRAKESTFLHGVTTQNNNIVKEDFSCVPPRKLNT